MSHKLNINSNLNPLDNPTMFIRYICEKNDYKIENSQLVALESYVTKLLKWNHAINLISRKDTDKIWTHHILSSISFLFMFEFRQKSSVLDIGTGGGLPGIPLSILCPEQRFTLIDSIQKKINAVQDIIEDLTLENVSTMCARAEELSKNKKFQCKFDYVIARSVAPAKKLLEWSKPFLISQKESPLTQESNKTQRKIIPAGSIILFKGGNLQSEIEEARIRHSPRSIQIFPIAINGINPMELFEKKVITIQP